MNYQGFTDNKALIFHNLTVIIVNYVATNYVLKQLSNITIIKWRKLGAKQMLI